MSTPRIGIGLPVYNGGRFLAETLDSLLAQTFGDFELIISDNASTDSTEEICHSYARRDKRIRYVRNEANHGLAANYRGVLDASSCEYFRWANSDDLFAPESLARCAEVLDRDPGVVLTYPKTRLIDAHGAVIGEYEDGLHLVSTLASDRFIQACERLGLVHVYYGLVRTSVLKRTRLIRPFPGGDVPLVAELALYGKFWEIPEVLFYRRLHPWALSNSTEAQRQEAFDPRRTGRPPLRMSKTLLAHVASVLRAPLGARERAALLLFLARSAIWSRGTLAREIWDAMRCAATRNGRSEARQAEYDDLGC